MKNYKLVSSEYVEEIHTKVSVYSHIKTGARICCYDNKDINKVFCIAFRTPPIDSTGLTHILEHSVLEGSTKFPVKDPFLELIKGSLNTFLNAFTFPDKTCYPFATTNMQDFKNIMSVYVDGVFSPLIYKREEIFRQEGWRYELFDKKDPISYNGVVYNEMKGAFSNPDEVLMRSVSNSLFPDNAYQYESGGDPTVIPELTYERFLNFHKKYYSPSNAYIFLYGDFDKEERMEWLDKEYLSKFEKNDFNTEIESQKPFTSLKEVVAEYPVGPEESLDKKAELAYSFAIPDNKDVKLNLAIEILNEVLIKDPGSPLKKAVQLSGLGESIDSSYNEGIKQPVESFIIKNTNYSDKEKLLSSINDTLRSAVNGGLDHNAILSHINHLEFSVREEKFSYTPKGLDYILTSLAYCLYDETAYTKPFKVFKLIDELRTDLKNGYFENIIQKYMLNNNHSSVVILNPSKTCQEAKEKELREKLAKIKTKLSEKEIQEIIDKSNALRKYQADPSTPEELATIPTLKLEDLKDKPEDFKSKVIDGEFKTYYQDVPSNGIVYGGFYFDITGLSAKDLQFSTLLLSLYNKLPTNKHSEIELNSLLLDKVGSFSTSNEVFRKNDGSTICLSTINFSCLGKNTKAVEELVYEIIKYSKFDDTKKIYDSLCETKNDMIAMASYSGNRVAMTRGLSHIDEYYYIQEKISNIAYLDFVTDLIKNFDSKKDEIVHELKKVQDVIFSKDRFIAYCTSDGESFDLFKPVAKDFFDHLVISAKPKERFEFVPDHKSEAIKAQFDVNYVARVGNLIKHGGKYTGDLLTLNNAILSDYLWMKVRVKYGAYGCFIFVQKSGQMALVSYRDPNIKETDQVYEELPDFIKNLNYNEREILKFKIGSVAEFNPVLHVSDQGKVGFSREITGTTYQSILKLKDEIINSNLESLQAYSKSMKETINDSVLCVFGNGQKIDDCKEKFDIIRNFLN
jgi:Zn-dependent M16 (insulinase) family peptidase